MLVPLFSLSWVGNRLEMAVSSRRIGSLPKGMARSDVCGAGWLCPCKVGISFNPGHHSNDPKPELFAAEGASPREISCAGLLLLEEVQALPWLQKCH